MRKHYLQQYLINKMDLAFKLNAPVLKVKVKYHLISVNSETVLIHIVKKYTEQFTYKLKNTLKH